MSRSLGPQQMMHPQQTNSSSSSTSSIPPNSPQQQQQTTFNQQMPPYNNYPQQPLTPQNSQQLIFSSKTIYQKKQKVLKLFFPNCSIYKIDITNNYTHNFNREVVYIIIVNDPCRYFFIIKLRNNYCNRL